MGTKSMTEESTTNVHDDMEDVVVEQKEEEIDMSKLAALKAKNQAKQQEQKIMGAKLVAEKERSIKFGIIGSGQAGSRLAEQFYAIGYPCVAINTALQDLKHINIPDSNKLLLDFYMLQIL